MCIFCPSLKKDRETEVWAEIWLCSSVVFISFSFVLATAFWDILVSLQRSRKTEKVRDKSVPTVTRYRFFCTKYIQTACCMYLKEKSCTFPGRPSTSYYKVIPRTMYVMRAFCSNGEAQSRGERIRDRGKEERQNKRSCPVQSKPPSPKTDAPASLRRSLDQGSNRLSA